MIAGIFYQGSGLGNQLHRYVMTRVLAEDKGCEWGMLVYNNDPSKEPNFKGSSFMSGDFYGANPVALGWPNSFSNFTEKKIVENGIDIRGYDPEINFVQDNTVIDGEFQDERYWGHKLDDIRKWLRVEPLEIPDDLCVIGYRGGEYTAFRDLYLPKSYWEAAIAKKRAKSPNLAFEVHTDDPISAELMLRDLLPTTTQYIHDIGKNWRSIRYAKHLIIANSSFFVFPALLNENVGEILAPRYWARHNTQTWALPQNYYKRFTYL